MMMYSHVIIIQKLNEVIKNVAATSYDTKHRNAILTFFTSHVFSIIINSCILCFLIIIISLS